MADFGSPVAQNVNPPNPGAGLQTLSSLMSLKQQQLGIARQQIGLQEAQQQLSSETSAATVAAVNSQQTKALSQLNPKKWLQPDGSLDVDAATQDVMQVAPNLGPGYLARLQSMAQGSVATKQAYLSLNSDLQKGLRDIFGTWAGDPKAKPSDLAQQLQAWQETLPTGLQDAGQQIEDHVLKTLTGPNLVTGAPHSVNEQKAAALGYARAGLAPTEVAGPAGLATPATGIQNTGGAQVPFSQSRTTGAVTHEPGSVATTISPQVVTQPGTDAKYIVWPNGSVTPLGGPGAVGGGSSSGGSGKGATGAPNASSAASGGAVAGTRAATNWWQPAAGQTQLLQANTAALAARLQAGNQAANSSPTAIDALTRARALLGTVGTATGTAFPAMKDFRNTLASMGVDTEGAQNASELAKNLSRYEAARAGSVGDTDAARALYEAGAPNTKMDAAAVRAVILQSLGVERMIQGYAKVVGSQPDPQKAMEAERAFRAVPNLVQTYEAGFMRSPEEAQEFLKRYGLSGKQVAQSAQKLKQMGAM